MILYSSITEESSIIVIISMPLLQSRRATKFAFVIFFESFHFFSDYSLVFAELKVVLVLFLLSMLNIMVALLIDSLCMIYSRPNIDAFACWAWGRAK